MPDAKRILIIDSDIGAADGLGDLCEALGYEVRCETNPRRALRAAIDFRPDLIALDLSMPVASGRQVLLQLAAHPATNGTQVLIVSGLLDERDSTEVFPRVGLVYPGVFLGRRG